MRKLAGTRFQNSAEASRGGVAAALGRRGSVGDGRASGQLPRGGGFSGRRRGLLRQGRSSLRPPGRRAGGGLGPGGVGAASDGGGGAVCLLLGTPIFHGLLNKIYLQ